MEGKNNGLVKGILTLILIVAVFSGILYGVNAYTAPIIEWNDNAALLAPLYSLLRQPSGISMQFQKTGDMRCSFPPRKALPETRLIFRLLLTLTEKF